MLKLTSNFLLIFFIINLNSPLFSQNLKDVNSSTNNIRTIVLDAGHGGKDPGAINQKTKEKDITLAITLQVGEIISKMMPDVKIVYTRKTDKFITLRRRSEIANENNADIFISIHCNYFSKDRSKLGSETYVMGLHKINSNLEVSKRENAAVELESDKGQYYNFDVNSPEGHIFLSTFQNAYLERSIQLADFIEKHLKTNKKIKSRGVKQAGFHVLSNTTMPSVLIETGFITNKKEQALLNSDDGQQAIAKAIVNAIIDYDNATNQMQNLAVKNESAHNTKVSNSSIVKSTNQTLYSIQIAASSKKNTSLLKRIPDCDVITENNMFKYLVGKWTNFSLAENRRKQLIAQGFKDAFIVAYKRDKRVTLTR